jgi:hypothetical protein
MFRRIFPRPVDTVTEAGGGLIPDEIPMRQVRGERSGPMSTCCVGGASENKLMPEMVERY